MASNWSNDYLTSRLVSINLDVSRTEQEALLELIQYLKNIDTTTDKDELAMTIQSEIFSIAQRRGLLPKGYFKMLYKILINAEKGPRLGNYIVDMGIKWAYEQLDIFCARTH
jgi:lysyl-tRNA synthetase class 1